MHFTRENITYLSLWYTSHRALGEMGRNQIKRMGIRKEGRKCFIYQHTQHILLTLYGIRHMVKDNTDSERGNMLLPHGLLFPISSKGCRQDNTYHILCYTSSEALAGTRNSSMGPPWRIDLMIHRTISERSYHRATSHRISIWSYYWYTEHFNLHHRYKYYCTSSLE